MQASVQYGDFRGTVAADEVHGMYLKDLLVERKVDTERFNPIGIGFTATEKGRFSLHIFCIDKENSTDDNPYIVSLSFEEEFTMKQFFELFKRFNLVLINRGNLDYANVEIQAELHMENGQIVNE